MNIQRFPLNSTNKQQSVCAEGNELSSHIYIDIIDRSPLTFSAYDSILGHHSPMYWLFRALVTWVFLTTEDGVVRIDRRQKSISAIM